MNKMFIIIPVMLAARKLDGEDPTTLYYIRLAYFSVQALVVATVVYIYFKASAAAKGKESKIIYVPPPPSLFPNPDAKQKYTETTYGAHIMNEARGLLTSTLFSILCTCGMHYFRNMIMGLAMQSVMGPLNMLEKPLAKVLLLGSGKLEPEDKIFGEKTADELTADDEIVDETGNTVVRQIGSSKKTAAAAGAAGDAAANITSKDANGNLQAFEQLLLDTWDAGERAELGPLMEAISKKTCNYQTSDNSWTPLMILAGLGVKGTGSAMKQVIQLGGNPAIADKEGWNALHWAAFHGSAEAAKVLMAQSPKLSAMKDREGKIPSAYAEAEGYTEVFKILDEWEEGIEATAKGGDGLRKRK